MSCEKETNNQPNQDEIQHLFTSYEGCDGSKKMEPIERKAVHPGAISYDTNNDTLIMDISLDYLCCAVFDTKARIENDTLHLEIIDLTTEFQKSYCRCICTYGFQFYFNVPAASSYPYSLDFITVDNPKGTRIYEGAIKLPAIDPPQS